MQRLDIENIQNALQGLVGVEQTERVGEVAEPYRGNVVYYLFRDSQQWSRRGMQMWWNWRSNFLASWPNNGTVYGI